MSTALSNPAEPASATHASATHASATHAPSPEVPARSLVTLARGDGIGPEISAAVLSVLRAAQAPIDFQEIDIGEKVYLSGVTSGIPASAWDSLRSTRVFLKGPITTPLGSGYKSLNVTARKALGLYANVRPAVTYAPFVFTRFPGMDVTVIRENEEDTYGGIEHRQTPEVTQCLKLISSPGCEKILRYAFEYARQHGRKKVTCLTKNNIMKLTDGLFQKTFDRLKTEYPEIATEHMIIDIGTAKLADDPARFDVIVTLNLYGDIVSDVTAQLSGSVGLAGSANIGTSCAMFEAVHGSAPDIAGKDIANPSGLLQAAVMMLLHLGHTASATLIQNAWLRTLEDGVHTADVYRGGTSRQKVGTHAFAQAVIDRLGQKPRHLAPAAFPPASPSTHTPAAYTPAPRPEKTLDGVDVFLDWDRPGRNPETLGHLVELAANSDLTLTMITNRGVKVYPDGLPETFCTDHWRCRFLAKGKPATKSQILALQQHLTTAGLDVIKTENLYRFDDIPGYSLGQGE